MTCDTGCGTFFMSGREYYNIGGKSYDGHNSSWRHGASKQNSALDGVCLSARFYPKMSQRATIRRDQRL